MVTAVSMLSEPFETHHIDMIRISVADYEERRRSIVPFVVPGAGDRVAPAHRSVALGRPCRIQLKGGMQRGNGRRMLVAGRILTGVRS
jgi:hypothetical protein